MIYDLEKFRMRDMIDAGRRLRLLSHCVSMETMARAIVDLLYENLRLGGDVNGPPACVLVRCFKTHPFGDLPLNLQERAMFQMHGVVAEADMQCLTLLASRGLESAWNDRNGSKRHQAIPLPSADIVQQAPMIHELILQLGMNVEEILEPTLLHRTTPRRTFNVFHVQDAQGSRMVPDQERFVQRYGVKSVLGFGGLLPSGELFAVILFGRVSITPQTAMLFRTLALGIKLALLPFHPGAVFEAGSECGP